MLRSMTGFGRCLLEEDNWTQIWEIRSVNSRQLDIRWRLPQEARAYEAMLEKLVKQNATRGRVEISLQMQKNDAALPSILLNEQQANALLDRLTDFAASRGDTYIPDYNRLPHISALWGENLDEPDENLLLSLETGISLALRDWNEARQTEGKALGKDISMRLLQMGEWVSFIEHRAPRIKEERFLQIQERVNEMLSALGQGLDENRFLQELVLLADRMDVTEELVRLQTHFARLHDLLQTGTDVGRKLDFTMQECFREITTCGNKVQEAGISRLVVDLKNELEKCREQVQNLE